MITRLHLILLLIIFFLAGLYVSHIRQKKLSLEDKPKKPVILEEVKSPQKEIIQNETEPEFELKAKEWIAIAGEYHKIAKKESRDVSQGQASLKHAKELYTQKNFSDAIKFARISIEQFKTTGKIGIKYTVKNGDNLWNIAKMKKHFKKGAMWYKIWRVNESKIKDFDLIYPEQIIYIPLSDKNSSI